MKTLSILVLGAFLAVSCSHSSKKGCCSEKCDKKTAESCCKDAKCDDGKCQKKS